MVSSISSIPTTSVAAETEGGERIAVAGERRVRSRRRSPACSGTSSRYRRICRSGPAMDTVLSVAVRLLLQRMNARPWTASILLLGAILTAGGLWHLLVFCAPPSPNHRVLVVVIVGGSAAGVLATGRWHALDPLTSFDREAGPGTTIELSALLEATVSEFRSQSAIEIETLDGVPAGSSRGGGRNGATPPSRRRRECYRLQRDGQDRLRERPRRGCALRRRVPGRPRPADRGLAVRTGQLRRRTRTLPRTRAFRPTRRAQAG